MIGVCTLNFPPSCYLLPDRTYPLAWQKLLNLSGLSAGLTGVKKMLTSTFFIATSRQLTTVVLFSTAWDLLVSLVCCDKPLNGSAVKVCSSQRLSWGSVKASRVCLGLKVNCVCHYNKEKYAKCWLNLKGIWNVWLVTRPVSIMWTSDITHSRRISPHGECQVKVYLSHTCNLNHLQN